MRRFVRRLATIMCAISLTVLGNSAARAAAWGWMPRAEFDAGYNSNVQLSPTDEKASASGTATLGAHVTRYSDAFNWSLDGYASAVRYVRFAEFNYNDVTVNTQADKSFETSQYSLSGVYVRDTTLVSELGSTGLTQVNRPHEHIAFTLSPAASISERWNLSGDISWSNDRYLEASNDGLVDYDYASADIQSGSRITERSTLAVALSYGRIMVPSLRSNTNQFAANLVWQSVLSEAWSARMAVGPLRVESKYLRDNGLGYSGSITRKSPTGSLEFAASRQATPNGRGLLTKRDTLSLSLRQEFSERLAVTVAVQRIETRDFISTIGFQLNGLRYVDASASLSWRITPTLTGSATVGGSTQTFDANDLRAHGYRASVGLTWQGLELGH